MLSGEKTTETVAYTYTFEEEVEGKDAAFVAIVIPTDTNVFDKRNWQVNGPSGFKLDIGGRLRYCNDGFLVADRFLAMTIPANSVLVVYITQVNLT